MSDFYLLELRKIPASIWTAKSTVSEWRKQCTAAGKTGFPPGSLGALPPCSFWVQLEVCVRYPLYFLSTNILPFSLPILPALRLVSPYPTLRQFGIIFGVQVSLMVLNATWRNVLRLVKGLPVFPKVDTKSLDSRERHQYKHLDVNFVIERNNHHYFGTKYVLPKSIVEQDELPPCCLCMAPHGVLPFGSSAASNKIFGGRPARFAAAPVLFKMPFTRRIMKQFGAYPAGKSGIVKCLEGGSHAALILDGIAGMFCKAKNVGDEELYLLQRKAICAIAMQTGTPIIPGYCFGTNDCCTIVDPLFGFLRWLSIRLDVSFTPFFGRWWLPLGPPVRKPLLFCFGDPIPCEKLPAGLDKSEVRTKVDTKHAELLEAYRSIFDTHKAAYGRPDAKLTFV